MLFIEQVRHRGESPTCFKIIVFQSRFEVTVAICMSSLSITQFQEVIRYKLYHMDTEYTTVQVGPAYSPGGTNIR
jgi:hypothetical protein